VATTSRIAAPVLFALLAAGTRPQRCQAGPVSCPSPPHTTGPLVSIEAVAVNGVPIPPSNCVEVSRGDIVESEIRISGWASISGGLRAFQVTVDALAGALSGHFGLILPLGWDAPLEGMVCESDADCTFEPGLHCEVRVTFPRICVGADHHPDLGIFLDTQRPDFALASFDVISGVGFADLTYIPYFASIAFSIGAQDLGGSYYGGTLILVVGRDACGEFEIAPRGPLPDFATVFISPFFVEVFPNASPLRIVVAECDCNGNEISDLEEIVDGVLADCDQNEIPDECEADCDGNGIVDACDLSDCGGAPACSDCNDNGVLDACDIAGGVSDDADQNGIPDECFIPIPTVSHWGLAVIGLSLLISSKLAFAGKRARGH
jgi:hypothetical protein